MRGLNSASLIRIVSNTPSRLRNTSSLVKRRTSNPSATSAAEQAASRAISSFVECVAPSPPDHGPGVDDHPRLETDEVGDELAEDNLVPAPISRDLFAPEALPEAALGASRITA